MSHSAPRKLRSSQITASDVAKYVIVFFQQHGDPITNLKLQKLLYYIQGWHLGLDGKPLFDQEFEAWIHGPVVPDVFHEYKSNKWNPIVAEIEQLTFSKKIVSHISDVLDVYGGDTGWSLEMRTHKERPWLKARSGLSSDEPSTNIITKSSMKNFFKNLANG